MNATAPSIDPPERVLVLRFSSAGDVVLTSPAIEALKTAWPDTEILYAVKKSFAPLIAHDPHVDRLLTLEAGERELSFSRRLKAIGFDAILDLHGKIRSKLLRLLLPRCRRVVWEKRPWQDNLPVRLGLRPYAAKMPIADRYHAAVEELVGRKLPRGHLRYYLGDDDQSAADGYLDQLGIDAGAPLIGMSPGANWETKRWPTERFAELAKRSSDAGFLVVLTGSKSEQSLAAAVAAGAPGIKDLTGKIPIGALGGVINRCRAFVANDSGPMHIARALGVPTLTFFGSTDPAQFEFDGHHMMYADAECAPCHFYGRRSCPRGHFECMMNLSVDDAWRNLSSLADAGRIPFVHA